MTRSWLYLCRYFCARCDAEVACVYRNARGRRITFRWEHRCFDEMTVVLDRVG